jgi:ribosomal protein S18 acetylase RimI-like enzyme
MTAPRAAAVQPVQVRGMDMADLTRVFQIEKQTPLPVWTMQNFKADLGATDRVNLVATFKGLVIGFALARSVNEIETPTDSSPAGAALTSTLPRRALCLNLMHLAVASDWLRRGVGTTLIRHLHRHLRKPEDCIRAVVPETNLPVQLMLRSMGFRATRVLRGFFNREDAYQMERRRDS